MRLSLLCNDRIALPALDYLLSNCSVVAVGIPDRNTEMLPVIKKRCARAGTPFRVFNKKDFGSDVIQWVKEYSPDMVLVMTFPFRVPPAALSLPEYGFINFHYAPLPEWRGANPLFWMLRNKVTNGGVTVHRMTEEFDAGPILLERPLPLGENINFGIYYTQLAYTGLQLTIELLKDPQSAMAGQREQDHANAKWYGHPKPADLFINWETMEAEEITALIKACNPWNKGAGTKWKNWTFGITYASVAQHNSTTEPGSILSIDPANGFTIACKNNKAVIAEVVYCEEGFYPGYCLSAFGLKQHDRLS
jgi:methionyl-tRNA formyltransferase